jgi:hypothetical protein
VPESVAAPRLQEPQPAAEDRVITEIRLSRHPD